MFEILEKVRLNDQIIYMTLKAPLIAKKAKAGQFVIIRTDKFAERIPLTIFDSDKINGTIDIVYQKVGAATYKLSEKNKGDFIEDVLGPLGKASELQGYNKVALISGGVGIATLYPMAKALYQNGCKTDIILGFRTKDLIIFHDKLKEFARCLNVVTDDGSNGNKGFVTDVLKQKIETGENYDAVISVGPIPMMKAVCDITKKYNIRSIVSMTAIMIDGTGMCGGCRLNVGGKTKFACIDGPDFDGHKVDFDEAMNRNRMFKNEEDYAREKYCNLFGGEVI